MPKRVFTISAGIILGITGVAKIVSAFGGARILENPDPVFGLQFGWLMFLAGIFELFVAVVCLGQKSKTFPAAILVAWLATNFLAYRLSLWWMGWHRPCSCMGNLTDVLHIPPQTADTVMKIILAYLLIGSYATLFWLWRQKRKLVSAPAPSGTTAQSPVP
jgi:hypothetical protein